MKKFQINTICVLLLAGCVTRQNHEKKTVGLNNVPTMANHFIEELYTKNKLYEHSNVDTNTFYQFLDEDGYANYRSEIFKGNSSYERFKENSILRIDTMFNSYYEVHYIFNKGFDNSGSCNSVDVTVFTNGKHFEVSGFRLNIKCP